MELSKSACALGIYKYACDYPGSDIFYRFYYTVLDQMQSWGVKPTYVGAEGDGYSGEFTKIGSRTHQELIKSNFVDVTVLSVTANPDESDEPSYDGFVSASLSYVEVNRELLACIVVNEAFVKIGSPAYDGLLRSQVELCKWDFGYGFAATVEKQPEFHILGLDNGNLSAAEYESLCIWYSAPGKVRTKLLRDVYPYNLLNEGQLDTHISDEITLRQFAEGQPGCSLTRLTEDGIHLWKVPETEITRLKKVLLGSSVLIS